MAPEVDFHKKILFGDEDHFWLNRYVNKQRCRISSNEYLQAIVETPLNPQNDVLYGQSANISSKIKPAEN